MVQLKPVTKENLAAVLALKASESQAGYVSTTAESLAQAYVYAETAFPFAVCDDQNVIGFIMMGYYEEKQYYTLWKLLIDRKYQGRGYGKAALEQGIAFLMERFRVKEVYTGVIPGNHAAKSLYRSMGFEETGLFENGMEEWRLKCCLMPEKEIRKVFAAYPEILYGFTDLSYCSYQESYRSALVFAVPYGEQLTPDDYTEERFEQGIQTAKGRLETVVAEIEQILQKHQVKYWIPPVAQENETELRALFSFKTAAAHAGIGWFGKNDVIITERYGPRVRLAAILIDEVFAYGQPITAGRCPEDCTKCIDICPCKALKNTQWTVEKDRSEIIDYQKCNRMRSAFIKKLGRKNACGLCLAACPFGCHEQESSGISAIL